MRGGVEEWGSGGRETDGVPGAIFDQCLPRTYQVIYGAFPVYIIAESVDIGPDHEPHCLPAAEYGVGLASFPLVLAALSTGSGAQYARPVLALYRASPYMPSYRLQIRLGSTDIQLSACFTGFVIGILGITNWRGFAFYALTSLFSAYLISALKCGFDVAKFVDQGPKAVARRASRSTTEKGAEGGGVDWKGWLGLMGVGQENVLGFLLFWIGGYALIHGESHQMVEALDENIRADGYSV
jgi:hypothetical protein